MHLAIGWCLIKAKKKNIHMSVNLSLMVFFIIKSVLLIEYRLEINSINAGRGCWFNTLQEHIKDALYRAWKLCDD